jgi:hypothetical protein
MSRRKARFATRATKASALKAAKVKRVPAPHVAPPLAEVERRLAEQWKRPSLQAHLAAQKDRKP